MRKGAVAPILYGRGVRVGIAAKYQRMEEALEAIASAGELNPVVMAKSALAFDPLSSND